MERPRIPRKAASHGMLHNRYSVARNPTYDAYNGRLLQESRNVQENYQPRPPASAVHSMLKTTTETGDIGTFSIKPTRGQRPPPQQPSRQQLRPRIYGHGYGDLIQLPSPERYRNQDDRRRLPSYNRGTTPSEVVSLYETASQKSSVSSRVQEEPEYRSYSMIHTSRSSYTLSNHKSYASLRSQPDPQLQRPRSPFPYPARLKRPGFRPSSPVLTDGAIDYSRRAEIERIPAVPHMNGASSSSSPISLYVQKRPPPLQNDASKSTPLVLVPSSPPRHQKSPVVLEDTHKRTHKRVQPINHNLTADLSPTSTHTSSSTVNLYQPGPPVSASNTPGRVPPPSPKYYDYTEDFFPDENTSSSPKEPPPRFQLERTIHEDRPLSATWSEADSFDIQAAEAAFSLERQIHPLIDNKALELINNDASSLLPPVPEKDTPILAAEKLSVKKRTRSSTIDSLEHIVQLYESNRNPSQPLQAGPTRIERLERDRSAWSSLQNSFDIARDEDLHDRKIESHGLEEKAKTFPSNKQLLDHWTNDTRKEAQNAFVTMAPKSVGDMVASHLKPSPHPSYDVSMSPLLRDVRYDGQLPQRSVSSQSVRFRSSKLMSETDGLQGLAQMLANYQPGSAPAVPPKHQSSLNRKAVNTKNPIAAKKHMDEIHVPRLEFLESVVKLQNGLSDSIPNYSRQVPPKSDARYEIPMLAPKPISPARQLKLKNSIPQLMKALPSLPKDQKDESFRALSPPSRQTSIEITLPFQFTPLFLETRTTATPIPESDEKNNIPVYQIAAQPTTPPPPPKLKLRRRTSSGYRPKSSSSSQPWNIDENYPWTNLAPNVRLSSIIKDDEPIVLPKRQKFKLKVSRPPKPSFGTVLINKDAGGSKKQVVFDLKNHKDFFAPNIGLDHVLQEMKRHFSSRKTSASSQNAQLTRSASSELTTYMPTSARSRSHENLLISKPVPVTLELRTPTENRSFFSDDSSQVVNSSLRRRLSHLRSRLPVPYASKSGAQSYDDILWRERSAGETLLLARTRLNMDIADVNDMDGAESAENPQSRRLRARARVSGWLEKARTAMAAVVKTGKSTEKRQNKMYSGV